MYKPYCYIDVDLTLIDPAGNLLPHTTQRLDELRDKYYLVAWSNGGAYYAKAVLEKTGILGYFNTVLSKPFIIVDDAPELLMQKARVVEITSKEDWSFNTFWGKLFGKDVKPYDSAKND